VKRYVLDSNLYIEADRDESAAEELDRFLLRFLPSIHLHAVVAQELLAGALDARRERLIQDSLVRPFEKRGRVIAPSFGAWKRAGVIVSRLIQQKRMSPGGFSRSFMNDCVLAASCREAGVILVTRNVQDFTLIQRVESVEVVGPWPE
jgi:predicted nucleic acid-binding protein